MASHNLDASPNIIRVTKLRGGQMSGTYSMYGRWEMHTVFWFENMKRGHHLEDIDTDGG